jgi:hypothetical protein
MQRQRSSADQCHFSCKKWTGASPAAPALPGQPDSQYIPFIDNPVIVHLLRF